MALDLLVDEKKPAEGQGLPGMGSSTKVAAVHDVPPSVAPTQG